MGMDVGLVAAAKVIGRAALGADRFSRAEVNRDLRKTLEMAEQQLAALQLLLHSMAESRIRPVTTHQERLAKTNLHKAADALDKLRARIEPALSPEARNALLLLVLGEGDVNHARVAFPKRHDQRKFGVRREQALERVRRAELALVHLRHELWEPRVGTVMAVRCWLQHVRCQILRRLRSEPSRPPRRFARSQISG